MSWLIEPPEGYEWRVFECCNTEPLPGEDEDVTCFFKCVLPVKIGAHWQSSPYDMTDICPGCGELRSIRPNYGKVEVAK
jgi:hypothetical protein